MDFFSGFPVVVCSNNVFPKRVEVFQNVLVLVKRSNQASLDPIGGARLMSHWRVTNKDLTAGSQA